MQKAMLWIMNLVAAATLSATVTPLATTGDAENNTVTDTTTTTATANTTFDYTSTTSDYTSTTFDYTSTTFDYTSTTFDYTSTARRENKLFWSTTTTKGPKFQCGKRVVRSGRIVGGRDTYEGEFPWTVSVRLLTTHFCGGTIINNKWILTAAHCVKRYSARYFRVRMGENDINVEESRPDLDVHVEEITVHPDFGKPRRYSNDVAVLKLKKPLDFNAFALPICLPSEPSKDLVGKNATVVGWGWLTEVDKGKSKAKRLQKVQVPVLNNSLCEKWYSEDYKGYVQIHDYQICAGYKDGGRDSCQGDSGGPLIMKDGDRYSIIGVVSAGVGCARKHMPGIYSRVSSFVPWIRNVTGIE